MMCQGWETRAVGCGERREPHRSRRMRLKANGKNGKAIVCAAMRKLIHLSFAILKSGKPFDPLFAAK